MSSAICPKCGFAGYTDDGPCDICNGYGLVYPHDTTCANCRGKGCVLCGNTGSLSVPYAFVTPAHSISNEQLQQAVEVLRTGYTVAARNKNSEPVMGTFEGYDDTIPSPYVLGVAAVLLEFSEEMSEYSTEAGEWMRDVLNDCERLVIDPTGVWCEHGVHGVRIYAYE